MPLAPISRVFLRGDVTLNASLLGKLGERGIGVVVMSGRKGEPTLLLGRPHNDAARRVAQYRLSLEPDWCLRFSRAIVEAKIAAQIGLISEARECEPMHRYVLGVSLRRMESCRAEVDAQPSIASLRGLEGAAAAAYFEGFKELFAERLHFTSRNRRPPRDPVNALLSLSYRRMCAHATPLEYSVFLFVGTGHGKDICLEEVCKLIDVRADDVRCYPLPVRGFQGRLGRAALPAGIMWTGLPAGIS